MPNWINNIISEGQDWGVFCDETNTGVRIEYNDLYNNPSGQIHPDCVIPGQPSFVGNIDVDPLFVDPFMSGCDFRVQQSSVLTAGQGGAPMGAVFNDEVVGPAGGLVEDTGSPASIDFPIDALSASTEVFIQVKHLASNVVGGGATTIFVDFLLIPAPSVPLPMPVTLTLPLRAPVNPGSSVALYRLNDVTGSFEDTGIPGTVDSTGVLAVFEGVTQLSTFVGASAVAQSTSFHPADTDRDNTVTIGEASGYAHCWQTGCVWDFPPNPVPVAFMTRGGLLWQLGEHYCNDPDQAEPLNWVICSSATAPGDQRTLVDGSFAIRAFGTAGYVPKEPVTIAIEVTPDPGTTAYALEDTIPTGWTLGEISDGGIQDRVNGMVKWGPFFDNQNRILTYQVVPPTGDSAPKTFSGIISSDGFDSLIAGSSAIVQFGDANSDGRVDLLDFAVFQACFGSAGGKVEGRCMLCNFDGDADVDLLDFTMFQKAVMSGGR